MAWYNEDDQNGSDEVDQEDLEIPAFLRNRMR